MQSKHPDQNVHMNAINIAEVIAPKVGSSVLETLNLNLASVQAQSQRLKRRILVQVNHPNWSSCDVSAEDVVKA